MATATAEVAYRPNPGPQEQFCRSSAFEVLYGGQAGGGKGFALLLEALRFVHVPRYRAIIFRRTFPSLESSQILESWRLCPALGGEYNEQKKRWRFPSGAVLQFGHLEHAVSVYAYQSAEFAYIGFDELTEFEEGQYRFLVARARTTAQDERGRTIPVRMRAATNPGGAGHEWVRQRWGAWLGSDPPGAESGAVRWYDVDTGEEVPAGSPGALSRQFIRARLTDNPPLLERDPEYALRLKSLPLLVRMALDEGRWDLVAEGNVFRRAWFEHIVPPDRVPEGLRWVRYYDLAASLKTTASRTATCAAALGDDGTLWIRDMTADRIEWPDQEELMARTMLREPQAQHGVENKLHGTAALQALLRRKDLAGVRLVPVEPRGDKLTRALAWSGRAEQGKVALVDGAWVPDFVTECCAFDGTDRTWNDRVDAVSGCVQMLSEAPRGSATVGGLSQPPRRSSNLFPKPALTFRR